MSCFILEGIYCNKLLAIYNFPYHIGVELSASIFIIALSIMIVNG